MPSARHPLLQAALLPILLLFLAPSSARAQAAAPDAEVARHQARQVEAERARLQAAPVLTPAPEAQVLQLPAESPCFTIRALHWRGVEDFSWLPALGDPLVGQCAGAQGLQRFREVILNALVRQGYVTATVFIPPQNLAEGRLTVQVMAGRIARIRDEGHARGITRLAFPGGTGGLLRMQDLDQALETLRRLPGQQETAFDILPGEAEGSSDILVRHPAAPGWQGSVTLDNAGLPSTGTWQLGLHAALASPAGLNDLLTLSLNRNANMGNAGLASRGSNVYWHVPVGYAALFFGLNQNSYRQTVIGAAGPILYGGRSVGGELGASRTLWRSGEARTSLQAKLSRKNSRSDIDGTEIDVQFRDVLGAEIGLQHQQRLGSAWLDLGWSWRTSLPSHSRAPGYILGEPEWDGRYRLQRLQGTLVQPFTLAAQAWQWQLEFQQQRASDSLPSHEYFSIGNRYTVRGFDGSATLAAQDGWTARQTLRWFSPWAGQVAYLGLDTGKVSGPAVALLSGTRMSGAALGWQVQLGRVQADAAIAWPLARPAGFDVAARVYTLSLSLPF